MSALNFKRINDEQSEVWRDGLVPHLVATEGVLLAVKQLCSSEVFKRFSESYPSIGGETTLEDPSVDSIASSLEVPVKP